MTFNLSRNIKRVTVGDDYLTLMVHKHYVSTQFVGRFLREPRGGLQKKVEPNQLSYLVLDSNVPQFVAKTRKHSSNHHPKNPVLVTQESELLGAVCVFLAWFSSLVRHRERTRFRLGFSKAGRIFEKKERAKKVIAALSWLFFIQFFRC